MSEPVYFEHFAVGDRVLTPARTITETDLVAFGALAEGSLASGLITLAIGGGLMFLAGDRGTPRSTLALFSLERVRLTAPARAGDTVQMEAEVTQTTAVDRSRGLVGMTHRMKNQRGEEILTYSAKLVVGRAPGAGGMACG